MLITGENVGQPGSLLGRVEDVWNMWGPGTLARGREPGALARRGGGTGTLAMGRWP